MTIPTLTIEHFPADSQWTHFVHAPNCIMTEQVMDYAIGAMPARYPVPALLVDSVSNLGERWSNWLDDMARYGMRF